MKVRDLRKRFTGLGTGIKREVAGQKLPRSSNITVHFKFCPLPSNLRRSPTLHTYTYLSKRTPKNGFHTTSPSCGNAKV